MTYVESRGNEPFDWNAFLNKESYTSEELERAEELSADWVTCACGNQCDIIPRNEFFGKPLDEELAKLGHEFDSVISAMAEGYSELFPASAEEWRHCAISILARIESRSAQIIKELSS